MTKVPLTHLLCAAGKDLRAQGLCCSQVPRGGSSTRRRRWRRSRPRPSGSSSAPPSSAPSHSSSSSSHCLKSKGGFPRLNGTAAHRALPNNSYGPLSARISWTQTESRWWKGGKYNSTPPHRAAYHKNTLSVFCNGERLCNAKVAKSAMEGGAYVRVPSRSFFH